MVYVSEMILTQINALKVPSMTKCETINEKIISRTITSPDDNT